MKAIYRILVYIITTTIIEVPAILILYSYGYPSNPASIQGVALLIAENLILILLAVSAVGGPFPGQGPRDISFDLVCGVASMFMIIAVVGETVNWSYERIMEITGKEEESVRFKRQFDSAVHELVSTTYSQNKEQEVAERKIEKLYSERPEQVIEYLQEIHDRLEKTGTTQETIRVETLVRRLRTTSEN